MNRQDKCPAGFREIEPKVFPKRYWLRQILALTSEEALRGLIGDIHSHGARERWTIREVKPLSASHPDRITGDTEYTHTVKVRYWPEDREGRWECVYAITSSGKIHLWMD